MSEFSLDDALAGQQASQGQNVNNQWGGQNPGQQQQPGQPFQGYPGYAPPGPGQQYPGYAPPGPGQQYPGYPPPGPGQQYPNFPGYPGFPAPGQPYPGAPTAGQSYPGGPAPGQPTAPSGPVPSAPAGPLTLPYTLPLNNGITPGLVITIGGSVKQDAKRFVFDLKNGDDIACHINPRFDESPNVIVRNTCNRGRWGSEERTAKRFPFIRGQPFKVQIICDGEQYRIMVNNEEMCQYKHRDKDLQRIRCVCINGDIILNEAYASIM